MREVEASQETEALNRPWTRRVYQAAVVLIFVLHFFASFHTVANFWQWGHAGFNGAGFFQAARNSVRHGMVVQTPYYTGLSEPGPGEYYTDHPMAVHFHMIGLHALFGSGEWVGRLVPTFYSFAALFALFFLLRREAGRIAALIGIALYAATPLHQIFATMIDHEQGCIFWLLICIHATWRWLDEPGPGWLATALIAISAATQFDWPGYYMAFFLMLFVFIQGLRHRPDGRRGIMAWLAWRREYTWAAAFSAVVLVNFFGFFGWIASIRGGIGAMIHAFFWRSASQSGYLQVLFEREQDLHGWLLYGLGAAWLVSATIRLLRRKLERVDLLPALFLVTQLIHSSVFSQAGKIHCYWTYYLGPFFAAAGAIVLPRIWRFVRARLKTRPASRFVFSQAAIGATLLALLAQGLWTARQQRWGFRSGTAAYVQHYDDGWDLALWGRELAAHYARERVHYLIHNSLFRPRLEFEYYLDAPKTKQAHLGGSAQLLRQGKQPVLLIDANRLESDRDRQQLARLLGLHEAALWDRRFIALDLSGHRPEPQLEAFVSRAQAPGFFWRWLVNPDRPPVDWVPDPDPRAARALFVKPALAPWKSPMRGGAGGGRLDFACSPGMALAGLTGQAQDTAATPLLNCLRPACRDQAEPPVLETLVGPWLGRLLPGCLPQVRCEADETPVGLFGRSAALVDSVGLLCRKADGKIRKTGFIGGGGGKPFELRCPDGKILSGLSTRTAHYFRALGIQCRNMPGEKE